MKGRVTIGLIGDRSDSVPAHLAIPLALENAAAVLGIEAAYEWVPTERINSASRVAAFDGLWCVPAQPVSKHGRRAARDPLRTRRTHSVPGHVRRLSARHHRIRTQRARLAGRDARRNRFHGDARRHLAAVVRNPRRQRLGPPARGHAHRGRVRHGRSDRRIPVQLRRESRFPRVAGCRSAARNGQGRYRRPARRRARRSSVLCRDAVSAGARRTARQARAAGDAFLTACARSDRVKDNARLLAEAGVSPTTYRLTGRGRRCFSQVTSGFQSVSAPLRLSSNAQTWIS